MYAITNTHTDDAHVVADFVEVSSCLVEDRSVDFDAATTMQLEDQIWIGCLVVVQTVCSVSLCLLKCLFKMHT
jgi:hypothetical protein